MCSVLPLPRCRRRHGALTGPHGHIVEKQETFDFVLTLKLQSAYMLDVHSLKYEAHGKFGKRNRCLRVPQCVSGNSLCHAMYTHTHTPLTFAPA